MTRALPETVALPQVIISTGAELARRLVGHRESVRALGQHPGWLSILKQGLRHQPYLLEATRAGRVCGRLPLALVNGPLFGRFLVSLPYLNSNGVEADDPIAAHCLVDQAVALADSLEVRHLELRQEQEIPHPRLNAALGAKVHMRLKLPRSTEVLWKGYDAKVRNQVRKGEKHGLRVCWGDHLDAFYDVLCHNMRDLGTPVYGRRLFEEILSYFRDQAEICVVHMGDRAIAAALLIHGAEVTEVPTASSLREFNATCANMLMYRHLIDRAVERGQQIFDFGRSTIDGPTYKFKKQWGAEPVPAIWQYYLRAGSAAAMRPDNPRYEKMIQLWRKLPVSVTKWIGPEIVRGIP